MALYFATHPDRHELWGRTLNDGIEKIVRKDESDKCSYESLYSACYHLCLHAHCDVLWAVMTKWSVYIAKHLNGEYLRERREKCIEVVDDIFLHSNKHVFVKSGTTASIWIKQKINVERLKNLRKWQRSIRLVGKMSCLYRRAVERVFAPGGQGAVEAGEHFKSVAAEEKPPADKKRKREEDGVTSLDQWYFTKVVASPYAAPEMRKVLVLNGFVFNHSKKKDGTFVQTSAVKRIEGPEGDCRAWTMSGTKYELLTPEKEYVETMNREGSQIYYPEGKDLHC